jgi:hypothetical protein
MEGKTMSEAIAKAAVIRGKWLRKYQAEFDDMGDRLQTLVGEDWVEQMTLRAATFEVNFDLESWQALQDLQRKTIFARLDAEQTIQ